MEEMTMLTLTDQFNDQIEEQIDSYETEDRSGCGCGWDCKKLGSCAHCPYDC